MEKTTFYSVTHEHCKNALRKFTYVALSSIVALFFTVNTQCEDLEVTGMSAVRETAQVEISSGVDDFEDVSLSEFVSHANTQLRGLDDNKVIAPTDQKQNAHFLSEYDFEDSDLFHTPLRYNQANTAARSNTTLFMLERIVNASIKSMYASDEICTVRVPASFNPNYRYGGSPGDSGSCMDDEGYPTYCGGGDGAYFCFVGTLVHDESATPPNDHFCEIEEPCDDD